MLNSDKLWKYTTIRRMLGEEKNIYNMMLWNDFVSILHALFMMMMMYTMIKVKGVKVRIILSVPYTLQADKEVRNAMHNVMYFQLTSLANRS